MSYYLRPEKDRTEKRYTACYDQALFNLLYVIHLDCDLKHKGHMAFDESIVGPIDDLIYDDVREMLYQLPAVFMRYACKEGMGGEFKENGLGKQWLLVERNWKRVQDELVPPAKNVYVFPRKIA